MATRRRRDKLPPAPGKPDPAEDAALWERVAKTVAPLPGRRRRAPPEVPAAPSEPPPPPPVTPAPVPSPPAAPAAPAPRPPPLSEGAAIGLDRRTAERLRRGLLPIEGRLDLHGMTQAQAHAALSGFLAGAQEAGQRCLLVITGKGRRASVEGFESSPGAAGVLKSAVPRWLNEPQFRSRVLAFAAARPQHGGAGAFYVLLRRKK